MKMAPLMNILFRPEVKDGASGGTDIIPPMCSRYSKVYPGGWIAFRPFLGDVYLNFQIGYRASRKDHGILIQHRRDPQRIPGSIGPPFIYTNL